MSRETMETYRGEVIKELHQMARARGPFGPLRVDDSRPIDEHGAWVTLVLHKVDTDTIVHFSRIVIANGAEADMSPGTQAMLLVSALYETLETHAGPLPRGDLTL